MLPDGRYVTDEDAAKQIKVTPITFRRWLTVGTMPQFNSRAPATCCSLTWTPSSRRAGHGEPAPGLCAEAGESRGVLGHTTECPRGVSPSGVPTHA